MNSKEVRHFPLSFRDLGHFLLQFSQIYNLFLYVSPSTVLPELNIMIRINLLSNMKQTHSRSLLTSSNHVKYAKVRKDCP